MMTKEERELLKTAVDTVRETFLYAAAKYCLTQEEFVERTQPTKEALSRLTATVLAKRRPAKPKRRRTKNLRQRTEKRLKAQKANPQTLPNQERQDMSEELLQVLREILAELKKIAKNTEAGLC